MAGGKYTYAQLTDRINLLINTNGIGAITGEIDNQVLNDIITSVKDWLEANAPTDLTTIETAIARLEAVEIAITAEQIVDDKVTVTHNKGTYAPFILMRDADGKIYKNVNWDYDPVDEEGELSLNKVTFTFQETMNYIAYIKA